MSALTFPWPTREKFPLVFLGFLLLSLLAHAVTFYVLQVEYPPAGSVMPPPAQVTLLTPSHPRYAALSEWLRAEDPAVAIRPTRPLALESLAVQYQPAFETMRAVPKIQGPEREGVVFPSGASQPLTAPDPPTSPAPPPAPPRTRVSFSGRFVPVTEVPPQLESAISQMLEPARFLIGIEPDGTTTFILPQASSGNEKVDQEAQRYLQALRFPPAAGAALRWSFAQFHWGLDAYAR